MADFESLIDELETANRRMYELVTAQEANEIREEVYTARLALTTAITALQAENERLKAQLAEAEADADRLAKELHDWLVFAEANDQIYAARSGMNAMLHHQKRKEGK